MATKTRTLALDQTTPVDEPTTELNGEQVVGRLDDKLDAMQAGDELTRLRAERKAATQRIKELEAARPSRLDREIAKQRADPTKWIPVVLARRVGRRVNAGQPRDAAIDAVLHQYRVLLEAVTPEGN